MTSILSQITCSIKIIELKWREHLVPRNYLQLCKNVKDNIAKKFFEKKFYTKAKKNKIFKLKNVESPDFWHLFFATKKSKEKFDILCSDYIDRSELEDSFHLNFRISYRTLHLIL